MEVRCDIDMCEGCAKHCHVNHKTIETNCQCGFKCQCGKDGFKHKCNSEFVGETCCYQHLYQCETCCSKSESQYICKSCVEECHKNHIVCDCGVLKNFCSCGMHKLPNNFNCHLFKFDEKEFSETKLMQEAGFVCPTCLEFIENEDFLMHSGFTYHKGCLKCCSCKKIIESNYDFKNFYFLKTVLFFFKN